MIIRPRPATWQQALDQIEWLEHQLGLHWQSPLQLALTKLEERLMGIMVAAPEGRIISRDRIFTLLYDGVDGPDDPVNIIGVHIHNLRRKCTPHAIKIETVRRQGWMLPARSRQIIADLDKREPTK